MYQPKIHDHLIRKLYFAAKREGKKMTHLINEILEERFVTEPEPPPYETYRHRGETNPRTIARKMKAYAKLLREYHGGGDDNQAHGREEETRGAAEGQTLAARPADRQDPV